MGGLMSDGCRPCVIICAVLLLSSVMGYRPVIIVHGILDGPKEFEMLAKFIHQSHPGTDVTTIALYDYMASMKPLWQQVESFREAIKPIMKSADDGVHLICFSQGGLICRGVLATLPTHNVHSLILLSSPVAGQYGDSSYLKYFFPKFIKSKLYNLCYTTHGQKISICNYWKDPHQIEKYLKSNIYLAPLNGEKEHANLTGHLRLQHCATQMAVCALSVQWPRVMLCCVLVFLSAWRDSFLRIETLVLIGGPDDGVITPWQSSIFGFYDSNESVVEMEKQDWYLRDAFGLKTLNLKGAVVKYVVPGVKHTSWHSNLTVYQNCIDKWLT